MKVLVLLIVRFGLLMLCRLNVSGCELVLVCLVVEVIDIGKLRILLGFRFRVCLFCRWNFGVLLSCR